MYLIETKELVRSWGNWLGNQVWDYFSTITYKFDINRKRNEGLMLRLENYLSTNVKSFKIFWVIEYTSNGYQTHNHILFEGKGVKCEIDNFLKKNKLINKKFIKHIPFKKELGANYYVSKYINSKQINYGFNYSIDYKLK